MGKPRAVFLGLPKTGTTSLCCMLKSAGKLAEHHNLALTRKLRQNLADGKLAFDGIDCEYWTQMDYCTRDFIFFPDAGHIRQMAVQYPHLLFVLNTRDVNRWYRSLENTRQTCELHDRMSSHLTTYPPFARQSDGGASVEQVFKRWFLRHEYEIKRLMLDYPDRFLVYDIERDDVELLSRFLKVPLKKQHKNKS